MGYQREDSSDPPLTVGPAVGVVCIQCAYSKYMMSGSTVRLCVDRRGHLPYYTVYDVTGALCVCTESYRVAHYYFQLCALGVRTSQMAQLDRARAKAPLRKI